MCCLESIEVNQIYTYESNDNCTSCKSFFPKSNRIKERSDFQYDENGNILERITYKKTDTPVRILKFTYFKTSP